MRNSKSKGIRHTHDYGRKYLANLDMSRAATPNVRAIATHADFKVGRRYPVNAAKLRLLPDDVQALIDTALGTRYEGEYTWLMWTVDRRKVTVRMTFDATAVRDCAVSDEVDLSAPQALR